LSLCVLKGLFGDRIPKSNLIHVPRANLAVLKLKPFAKSKAHVRIVRRINLRMMKKMKRISSEREMDIGATYRRVCVLRYKRETEVKLVIIVLART
jgi:hypothetical protein